jgi:16S rRNA C967 or C1407 C5-methylase (RsmB/RsmF family)
VIRDFLAGDPSFALDPPATFPIAAGADGFVRCLPHQHGTDGFTVVRLRRR